jgi:hypothetical protein
LRSASLLEYLAHRYDVDIIVFRQPGAPDPAGLIPARLARRITVLDLPANRRSFAARALRNAGRIVRRVPPLVDRFAGFSAAVAGALGGARYNLGVIEHSWCAPYLEQLSAVCTRTVLDLHSVEACFTHAAPPPKAAPSATAHRVFQGVSEELSAPGCRASLVLAPSQTDAEPGSAPSRRATVAVYPNALPHAAAAGGDQESIVFSGNMEYHPNRSAVRFFRLEIWPRLRDRWPQLVWRLVGKNPAAVQRFTRGDSRIEVVGPIPDAVFELARSRVAVVPLLSGSGTRLKILEAWAAAVPVVSTSLGAEGLPVRDGENVLIADSAESFAGAVTRLLACTELRHKIGDAGRLLQEKEFTWDTAWKKLDL